MKDRMKDRLIVYIDGFNLYRGMQDSGMRALYWLDLRALAEFICPKHAQVSGVKYFTARILNLKRESDPGYKDAEASRRRQINYIDALRYRGVEIFEGKYKRRTITCRSCKSSWVKPEEKMSDVQLATQLLSDAFRKNFDAAMVVSGDADVSPPIRVVVSELGMPVTVAFPPNRTLEELKTASSGFIHINRHSLAKSQLPDEFDCGGHTFRRPAEWSRKSK